MQDNDRRVFIDGARRVTGLHATTIWRKCKAGEFPSPTYIGERRSWLESELLAWVKEQAERPRQIRNRNLVNQGEG
jgi:predicted DNA-binding transcriptional regulator AlpA